MATYDKLHHTTILTDEEARAGVTGHNVRYVLAFGMAGVIAAFAAIAIYFGFDRLHSAISAALAQSPAQVLWAFVPYVAIVLLGAIAAGLFYGLWNLLAGRSGNESEKLMRLRVATQFGVICIVMALFAHVVG